MKTKLLIFSILLSLASYGQFQQSELNKGLIFHTALDEWNGARDFVSGTVGTATDVYPVLGKGGEGRRWLDFDGSNDQVFLPTVPAFGTGDFSVISIITLDDNFVNTYNTIVGGSTNSFNLWVYIDGTFRVRKLGGTDILFSNTPLVIDTKYTVTYKRTGTTGTLFVNGVSQGSITDDNDYTAAVQYVGNGVSYFSGSISMCRIFNYALSETDIAYYSKPENPIKWVDRGAGEKMVNSSITGSNGWSFGGSAGYGSNNVYINADGTSYVNRVYQIINENTLNKKYKLSYNVIANTVVGVPTIELAGTAMTSSGIFDGSISGNLPGGITSYVVTGNGGGYIGWHMVGGSSGTLTLDDLSVTQLGCILDLNAEGLSLSTPTQWIDKTNSLTSTVSGATLIVPSASNLKASSFNGSTSKVAFTGRDGLTGDMTISIPFYLLDYVGRLFDSVGIRLTWVYSSGQKIGFSRDGWNVGVAYSGAITINTAYSLTITSTSAGVTNIYINGVLSGTANQSAGTPVSGTSWNIGNNAASSEALNGILKYCAVWSRILTPDEIQLLNDIQ